MPPPVMSPEDAAANAHMDAHAFSSIQRAMMTRADDMAGASLSSLTDDADSWQMTYMDIITLLFAAFVLLLALYGNQISRQQEVLEGMNAIADMPPRIKPRQEPEAIEYDAPPEITILKKSNNLAQNTTEHSAAGAIAQRIASLGLGDMITLEAQKGGLIITMKETLLFPSGKATLSPQGASWLRDIAPTMKSDAAFISVEGHTDNVPINTERFPSNWELSAGRATSVVRELVDAGIPPDKLRAIGYADSRPIGFNAFPSGREQNRRVQIKLDFAETAEN